MENRHVRRRGVALTAQGARKLNQAKAEAESEQNFKRFTLEILSEKTGLTPTTLSKVFTGSSGVDKRTLECCFNVFDLTLLREDYRYLTPDRDNLAGIVSMLPAETGSDLESNRTPPKEVLGNSPAETVSEDRKIHQLLKQKRQLDDLQPGLIPAPGGPMPLDSVFYIDRPPLESLCYEAIQQPGALLNIRAPKQMGKTSLMARTLAFAKTLGYRTVAVNLQLADAEILSNLGRLLQWFCARTSKQLEGPDALVGDPLSAIADCWDATLGSKSNATDYFNDVLLANLDCPLAIAIDELNLLLAYPKIACEFLLLLRTWSEQARARAVRGHSWSKLRLVTLHSTEVLMPASIDPAFLNTGLMVELPEFTLAQVRDLAARCGLEIGKCQIEQLLAVLRGHPYRLQLAFYHLQQQILTLEDLLENSAIALAIYAEHLQQQWWNLQHYPELWPIFTQIVSQTSPVECEAAPGIHLKRMGLIHFQELQASLACELFRPFFRERLAQVAETQQP